MNMLTLLAAFALILATSAATIGCQSSQKTADTSDARGKTMAQQGPIDTLLAKLDPEFFITNTNGRTYLLSFAVGAGGRSTSPSVATLRRIMTLDVQIYGPDGAQLASLVTQEINTSGMPNTETGEISLTAAGGVEWKANQEVRPGTYAVMTLQTDRGSVMERIEFPGKESGNAESPKKTMELTLEVEDRAGGVEFVLTVERIAAGPEDEYLPSGEKFRIDLQSEVGESVWSSSKGKMFTMAIGPVEPDQIGEKIVYRAWWDGRDDRTHSRATPGTYRVVAMIPAKPTPYILREEFTWSGR